MSNCLGGIKILAELRERELIYKKMVKNRMNGGMDDDTCTVRLSREYLPVPDG
ncbi:hypothetical protein JOC33_002601 [Thalassobacillus pellis]|nr:hypothetical protein [Thalassobacillus pellis]